MKIKNRIDAFVVAKYSGIKAKTKVVTSTNPEWNQQLTIGCMLPNQSKYITIEAYDYDFASIII